MVRRILVTRVRLPSRTLSSAPFIFQQCGCHTYNIHNLPPHSQLDKGTPFLTHNLSRRQGSVLAAADRDTAPEYWWKYRPWEFNAAWKMSHFYFFLFFCYPSKASFIAMGSPLLGKTKPSRWCSQVIFISHCANWSPKKLCGDVSFNLISWGRETVISSFWCGYGYIMGRWV